MLIIVFSGNTDIPYKFSICNWCPMAGSSACYIQNSEGTEQCLFCFILTDIAFSAMTLLVGRQEGHPACKKLERWGTGMVVCLELGADLHMAQLMPLPLTVSCFSEIQIGFTFLIPAHLGSPGKRGR